MTETTARPEWNEAVEGAVRYVRREYPEAVKRIEQEARSQAAPPSEGLRGKVLWPAGANWTSGKREVIVELAPIGEDGRCTGCHALPARETGSCKCLPTIAALLSPVPESDPERE